MNKVIVGTNVSEAWIRAAKYLGGVGGQTYNLIVEVNDPTSENYFIKQRLDQMVSAKGNSHIETVANTIFPKGLAHHGAERTRFYERFSRIYSTLRRVKENNTGTYFGRLVKWNYENPDNSHNQLEATIQKLGEERKNLEPSKMRYEMSIYDPPRDHAKPMGFPCMSFISLKIRNNTLDMTAIYRNQHFMRKAYGNYLGLGRLLHYIATESGYPCGILTCISTHAELEGSYQTALKNLYVDSGISFDEG